MGSGELETARRIKANHSVRERPVFVAKIRLPECVHSYGRSPHISQWIIADCLIERRAVDISLFQSEGISADSLLLPPPRSVHSGGHGSASRQSDDYTIAI